MKTVDIDNGVIRGTCWETHEFEFRIELQQTGIDRFTVIYGKQVKNGLNYTATATELGACIMHALACDGKLDNTEIERRDGR